MLGLTVMAYVLRMDPSTSAIITCKMQCIVFSTSYLTVVQQAKYT